MNILCLIYFQFMALGALIMLIRHHLDHLLPTSLFINNLVVALFADSKIALTVIIHATVRNGRADTTNIAYIGQVGGERQFHFMADRATTLLTWRGPALHTK